MLPKIAIVGRPNVGKSALFNRIASKRIAIVDEAEGITRDRIYAESDYFGRPFLLIDTGGIDSRSTAAFQKQIHEQAKYAIAEADGLILVVDSQVGATELDLKLARILHQTNKPLALAVNKIDTLEQTPNIHQFHNLGISSIHAISALHGRNIPELLSTVLDPISHTEPQPNDDTIKLAFIGRPNVGKSTLLNTLLGEERTIVSETPGTTRDSIAATLTSGLHTFTLVDTAGIRKKQVERETVEKFAAIRTQRAIELADICVLVCEAQEGLTAYEKRIAMAIEKAGKGCLLWFNKWDLVKGIQMEKATREIRQESPFLSHCPLIFGSAKTGRKTETLLPAAAKIALASKQKIATGPLNKFIETTLQKLHPPMINGKRLRIYYMTQTGNAPLRFVLFVNQPKLMSRTYHRFLINQFRHTFGCEGNPLSFQLRGKRRLK